MGFNNPCREIELDLLGPVQPWVQVELMNHFRIKAGNKPYTLEEAREIERKLKACDSIGRLET